MYVIELTLIDATDGVTTISRRFEGSEHSLVRDSAVNWAKALMLESYLPNAAHDWTLRSVHAAREPEAETPEFEVQRAIVRTTTNG